MVLCARPLTRCARAVPSHPLLRLQLAKEFEAGIPCDESILLPKLRELLIHEFGARPRQAST